MTIQSESFYTRADSIEQRLQVAMWRAKPGEKRLTPPKLAAIVGVSAQTIRNWLNPEDGAKPNHAEVLAIAVATNTPVEELDPTHPQAGLRWSTAEMPSTWPGNSTRRNRTGPGRNSATLRGPSPTAPAAQKVA